MKSLNIQWHKKKAKKTRITLIVYVTVTLGKSLLQ